MKRSAYVFLSAILSLLLHILFLSLADRIQLRTFAFEPPEPETKVRISLTDVREVFREEPERQKLIQEAQDRLKDAVAKSPKVKQILDQENLSVSPPKAKVRLQGLGDSLLKPDDTEPLKPRIATAPPPKLLEIDGDALPRERQALERRLHPKVPRYDIPDKQLPSLLPPGPFQSGVGQTFDVSMRMGALPGVPGLKPGDVASLDDKDDGTKDGTTEDGADRGGGLSPRDGIPGLKDLGETGGLGRNPFGEDPLAMLDDFVTVSVVVHPDARGGGYFRADISPNPRSEALRAVPKDILIAIDHSTSISGPKLEQFKAATVEALQYLNPKDRFDVISFNQRARRCFGELVPVNAQNLRTAQDYVRGLMRGGMTDVFGSLSPFVSQNNPDTERPLNVFLLSDGNSTVNIREDDEFVRGIVKMNPGNVSIYSFSAGSKANQFLMQFLGYLNRGFSLHVDQLKDFEDNLVRYISTHASLIVADLRYRASGGLNDEIYPKRLPHLYRGETLSIFGRYPADVEELTLSLIGTDGTGKRRELLFRRDFDECPETGSDLAQSWATQKIFHLIGERTLTTSEERRAQINAQIADLARQYSLYVPY